MSTSNPTHGTKVTSDPERRQNPVNEGPGELTSDSLAAESTRAGGGFAENAGAEPSGVPSKSSTASNTDTSNATALPPAPDAERRGDAAERPAPQLPQDDVAPKHAEAVDGQAYGDGHQSNGKHVPLAPSYVTLDVTNPAKSLKVKGTNLTEGGFDSDDSKNASFNADIGSENDPGRLAEQKFQRASAENTSDAAGGPRQKNVSGGMPYEALSSEQQA
ncbi:MAG: hypothetical protein M1838_001782 [Thelocarpon superellum]|nr:MAG: hypothetical protein M1838_001782 [Thelocarpon superellum]